MMRVFLHILILLAMLWVERRSAWRLKPVQAGLIWYLLGVPLMLIEAQMSGSLWLTIFLQSLVAALFFLPPAFAAFWLAGKRNGVLLPFLLYLVLSCPAGIAAGLSLAHSPFVFGSLWKA